METTQSRDEPLLTLEDASQPIADCVLRGLPADGGLEESLTLSRATAKTKSGTMFDMCVRWCATHSVPLLQLEDVRDRPEGPFARETADPPTHTVTAEIKGRTVNAFTRALNPRRALRPLITKAWMAMLAFALVAMSPGLAVALAGAPITISISNSLNPSSVTIEPGTSVTWVNNDSDRHRMASQSGPERFDSGNLDPGQSFTMVFDLEGTYSYVDDRDEDNSAYFGTIIVSSGAPSTPPPGGGGGSGGGPVSIDVGDRIYRPASVTVSPGTTITWTNIDDRPHTVTD